MKFLSLKCFHEKYANSYKKTYKLNPMLPLSMFSSPLMPLRRLSRTLNVMLYSRMSESMITKRYARSFLMKKLVGRRLCLLPVIKNMSQEKKLKHDMGFTNKSKTGQITLVLHLVTLKKSFEEAAWLSLVKAVLAK